MSNHFGIEAIEIYFPKTYVDQTQFQKFNKVSTGKYVNGLGQLQLSFSYPFQDVNSFCLTVVSRLLKNNNIKPQQVGRLEVGTETLIDKSKSSKTVLMELFKNNHDIEGATSINACYGATNALINTLNWITSTNWDGRYGIVVASDVAVYQKGPARCTGGAGAVALLIGPKGKVTFNKQRCSFMDHKYDFYKPNPNSQYPIVDGKISIDCYLNAVKNCYQGLKNKLFGKNILKQNDYFCFHSPFYKMVQKAFSQMAKTQNTNFTDKQIAQMFTQKVHPTMNISQRIGNIYTGSLFSTLIGLMISGKQVQGKKVGLFSYGSGLCSTLLTANINKNLISNQQIQKIKQRLNNRIKISPQQYDQIMYQRQKSYGKFFGKIKVENNKLDDQVYYLSQIDQKYRRKYQFKSVNISIMADKISEKGLQRIGQIDKKIVSQKDNKFYKMSIPDRIQYVNQKVNNHNNKLQYNDLITGGLKLDIANTMTQNVIGLLSLPLSIVPQFVINHKKIMVPMCIQQPSVVAACSSIGKFLSPYSFYSSCTPSIMIGQIHMPQIQAFQINQILNRKQKLLSILNSMCISMVKRGGGVKDIRARQLNRFNSKQYVIDVIVNVCDAMGANIINTLCQSLKIQIMKMGYSTGIAILSNYCTERKSIAWFQIPVKAMGRKGYDGITVCKKIIQAYQFAKKDIYRASTHNKGIMNGIDSVCLATGQDWRAVESAAHTYASRNKTYQPLTHYQIIYKNGQQYFKGQLQLPIAVGSVGGVINKNPLYKSVFQLMGNPNSQQLSQILVCVGLAQNFAALRALALQGIQNGHMKLHGRTIAKNAGVPEYLLDQACQYMTIVKKYDEQSCRKFLDNYMKAKL